MATTAPPPPTYDEAMAKVRSIAASINPENTETKAKLVAAMAAKLQEPETAGKLLAEVRALGDGARKVNDAFNRVYVDLGTVDNNNYKDKNGAPIPKFQPKWKTYHEVRAS